MQYSSDANLQPELFLIVILLPEKNSYFSASHILKIKAILKTVVFQ